MVGLSLFRRKREQHKADAAVTYDQFVAMAADGKDFDLDALVRLLIVTGGTMANFDAAVELVERRASVPAKRKKLAELKARYEAASRELAVAVNAIDDIRKRAEELVENAMTTMRDKSDISGSLSRQVNQLEAEISEDLMSTCDPELQNEIDRLESQARVLTERHCNGRRRFFSDDPSAYSNLKEMNDARDRHNAEIAKGNDSHNAEIASIQTRLEELRAAQVAV